MNLAKVMGAGEDQSPKSNKKEDSGKGDLRSIRITKAENGFSISCDYEPKPGKKNEPSPYIPPEEYVFETSESVSSFVKEMLSE